MPDPTDPLTPKSRAFLDRTAAAWAGRDGRALAERVETLVQAHDDWRRRCLNLNPAESGLSLRVQRALANDMAARLSEGLPGDKTYPHGVQNAHVDELEALVIGLVREQFAARFVEWRPVSTSMANAAVFFALLQPGDVVLSQAEDGGGNFSYHAHGPAGLVPAAITDAPWSGDHFEIDAQALAAAAERLRPRMIVVGGSNVLFPYPVRELREIADRCGAWLVYDAAHLGLLISSGQFQRPLAEGAHVVTVSTHKIMGGPVGGLALTDDPAIARRLHQVTFPGLMQTRDQNKYAALAIALAETRNFGPELASRMVANAQALAAGLTGQGFELVAAERGYTQTHQLFLRLGDGAQAFEARCQAANILASDCALAGDLARGRRTGARLATHELTRRGLDDLDMGEVARLIARAWRGEPAQEVAGDVAALLERRPGIAFSFDDAAPDR